MTIPCDRALNLLHDALDAALDGDARAALDEHLASCPPCVEAMVESIRIQAALQGLGARERAEPAAPIRPDLAARFVRAMSDAATGAARSTKRRRA
jgi:anti-sigma factor RsiW